MYWNFLFFKRLQGAHQLNTIKTCVKYGYFTFSFNKVTCCHLKKKFFFTSSQNQLFYQSYLSHINNCDKFGCTLSHHNFTKV